METVEDIISSWLFYLSFSQHPLGHIPQSLLECHTIVVWKEVCRCAVSDDHIGAGPHCNCCLVPRVQRREPDGLCPVPPHRIGVIYVAEVLVADRVVHVTGKDTVRLSVQPCHLEEKKPMAIIIVMIVKTHYYANILCFWVYSFIFYFLPHLMGLHLKCSWTKPVYVAFPCLLDVINHLH